MDVITRKKRVISSSYFFFVAHNYIGLGPNSLDAALCIIFLIPKIPRIEMETCWPGYVMITS